VTEGSAGAKSSDQGSLSSEMACPGLEIRCENVIKALWVVP
jgi:hypothetical protein